MYGNHVTTIEAQTQIMVRNALRSQVPVPGVLGWVKDGGSHGRKPLTDYLLKPTPNSQGHSKVQIWSRNFKTSAKWISTLKHPIAFAHDEFFPRQISCYRETRSPK
ncbi:predicted protein [Histoplasma capsulatum G186AR]|uniref:Uncharacterized protein n=1 Tax=Ajellomyces capsulatus (strain G186AR / H82 / ATCC MYA-2454 / RMSCC 2432) TaxID=447093 RepID=C0NPB4_AJECG|nr:uncharacterized protein HCBG_04994 [Histoplasma capsulatum G186AR]EEH06774.1 predicted protein [Histoplasma capsulatum G186AR]